MVKRIAAILALGFLSTGCQNVRHTLFPGTPDKPGTDAASVCRATPTWSMRDFANTALVPNADNIDIFTGETTGQDGVTETAYVCPTPLVPFQTFDVTGCISFTT